MQTPIRNFEESKPVSAGAMTPFNVNCYNIIDDLVLEFTKSGTPATLTNCKSSISRIVILLNGINILDVSLSQLVDLYGYLGTKVTGTLVNAFCLNIGRLLYDAGIMQEEFAWRCGRSGNTNPSQKISSLVVQVYAATTVTGITDVQLYSLRRNIEADWNDSYIQFNNNVQSFSATGQSQVNTLPKNANDLFLLAIAYNGGGVISEGETLVNNVNVSRAISAAVNTVINNQAGFGTISGAYVHSYINGFANAGLLVRDVTSELSVRTTFTTAPTAGKYDMPVVKIHNCPAKLMSLVQSDTMIALDTIGA